jgi:NAD(P)-dependent dehydrogenase (short-subunit alcohol dehydrogenase family)
MAASTVGRIAVVTGGTAGVGRATVRELTLRGYDIAVLARGRAGLEATVAEVRAGGRRAIGIPTDVADHDAVERAATRTERELGEIDLWVNNAFVGALAFFWDTSPEEYKQMTDITYIGQVDGTRSALARMRPRNRGVIVNVCSAMSYRAIPLQSAYCGAKHAVKGFSESIMTELRHDKSKVKVCLIQLPGLNTPQFNWNLNKMPGHPKPVAPFYQPELPAKGIAFLAEHPRRNMWIGVPTAYTVIGERLAPKIADIYLGLTAVKGQQTDADLPRFAANTEHPADEDADQGAHGPFDDRAYARDPVTWLSMHRRTILSGVGASALVSLGAAIRSIAGRQSMTS